MLHSPVSDYLEKIRKPVINMFRVNMGVRQGERVLVVTDYPEKEHWVSMDTLTLEDIVSRSLLARLVYEIARSGLEGVETDFLVYPLTGRHGAEPPDYVGEAMASYDVVVAITSFSLSHTNAREKATRAGARIASMPGFTIDMFMPGGPMDVDYKRVSMFSRKLAEYLEGAKTIRVVTEKGTDIVFSVEGRKWDVDDGIYDKPGLWGNLPAGEVFIAPVEGTANGKIVVEAGWYPGLKNDMAIYVKDGLVVDVKGGGSIGEKLRQLLGLDKGENSDVYKARRNIAEFGIGTNPNARRPDNILEAEKILGTVHIAIGDNKHFGGIIEADIHEDFIIPRPTVYVDDEAHSMQS